MLTNGLQTMRSGTYILAGNTKTFYRKPVSVTDPHETSSDPWQNTCHIFTCEHTLLW